MRTAAPSHGSGVYVPSTPNLYLSSPSRAGSSAVMCANMSEQAELEIGPLAVEFLGVAQELAEAHVVFEAREQEAALALVVVATEVAIHEIATAAAVQHLNDAVDGAHVLGLRVRHAEHEVAEALHAEAHVGAEDAQRTVGVIELGVGSRAAPPVYVWLPAAEIAERHLVALVVARDGVDVVERRLDQALAGCSRRDVRVVDERLTFPRFRPVVGRARRNVRRHAIEVRLDAVLELELERLAERNADAQRFADAGDGRDDRRAVLAGGVLRPWRRSDPRRRRPSS